MKISCIILNYNDAETTVAQIERVRDIDCFDAIVVVDNCSTDDSLSMLTDYKSEKVVLLAAEKNGGYGSGNNLGLRYSYDVLHMTHAVIANPDTVFTAVCIRGLAQLFKKNNQLAASSPLMSDASDGGQASSWPLLPWFFDLLNTGPICRRLFKRACRYPQSYYDAKKAVYVEVLHGSLLMVDIAKVLACGGYDEGVFLYNEEAILGFRLKQKGYRSVQYLDCTYFHQNSASISKTYQDVLKRQVLRHESALFYYQKYLQINRIQKMITIVFHQTILLELWFCKDILKMKW